MPSTASQTMRCGNKGASKLGMPHPGKGPGSWLHAVEWKIVALNAKKKMAELHDKRPTIEAWNRGGH